MRFSEHQYNFPKKVADKWIKLLRHFYGDDFRVNVLACPSVSNTIGILDCKLSDAIESIKKCSIFLTDDSIIKVNTGKCWTGATQRATIPLVPDSFRNNNKIQSAAAEDFAIVQSGWDNHVAVCISGFDVSLAHKEFKGAKTKTEMYELFRSLLMYAPKITRAFYDPRTSIFHILEPVTNKIICISPTGVYRGDDIDFDIDDGFLKSDSKASPTILDWNKTYFQPWLKGGMKLESVFHWLI